MSSATTSQQMAEKWGKWPLNEQGTGANMEAETVSTDRMKFTRNRDYKARISLLNTRPLHT